MSALTAASKISDPLLVRAAAIGAASLHEAGGGIGALPERLRPISPAMRMAGRAFPVRCPVGDNLWLHHAIAAAEPGDVLVADVGAGAGFGYWGEIMTSAAQARRLAALVITGGVRDSGRLSELGFPVFATGTAIRGTGKDPNGDGALCRPIRVGDVVVRHGDLVVGDADGVVCIGATVAADVIASAERRDEREQTILGRIAGGETTLAIYHLPTPTGLGGGADGPTLAPRTGAQA